jgi:hypothetical protein
MKHKITRARIHLTLQTIHLPSDAPSFFLTWPSWLFFSSHSSTSTPLQAETIGCKESDLSNQSREVPDSE